MSGRVGDKGRVGVLVSSYNHAAYLCECIDSALAQDYGNLVVYVVDDGSEDGSDEVLRGYGDAIELRCRGHLGGVATVNELIDWAISDGCEYLAFLNSDDSWVDCRKVSKQVALGEDLVFCGVFGGAFKAASGGRIGVLRELMLNGNCFCCSSALLRVDALGELRCDEGVVNNDYGLWFRMLVSGASVGYVEDVMVRYREHDGNFSKPKRVGYLSKSSYSRLKFLESIFDLEWGDFCELVCCDRGLEGGDLVDKLFLASHIGFGEGDVAGQVFKEKVRKEWIERY